MTRLLMITNEAREGTEYGLRDEFARLLATGLLEAYDAVAPLALAREGRPWADVGLPRLRRGGRCASRPSSSC